jgi:two-component system, OmpR family, response regulator
MAQPESGKQLPIAPVYVKHFQPGSQAADTRILCITEDPDYAERDILPPLRRAGVSVDSGRIKRGESIENWLGAYDAILLDIGARNSASFEICSQVRIGTRAPIMLVLHGAARSDVLQAYRSGADAYVLAPFDPREFLARLGGLLRRSAPPVA